ncbi:DUF4259 domain-containing protein [Hymenobacter tenuis]
MATNSLQNLDLDDAADFLAEFEDDPSEVLLLEALVSAAEEDGYLEIDTAAPALAAAEVVAAYLGAPAPGFPPALLALTDELDVSDEDELIDLAQRAVQAVAKKSELLELYQQAGQEAEWQAVQQDLLKRLA